MQRALCVVTSLRIMIDYQPHFTDEKTEAQRGYILPKTPQLGSGGGGAGDWEKGAAEDKRGSQEEDEDQALERPPCRERCGWCLHLGKQGKAMGSSQA